MPLACEDGRDPVIPLPATEGCCSCAKRNTSAVMGTCMRTDNDNVYDYSYY